MNHALRNARRWTGILLVGLGLACGPPGRSADAGVDEQEPVEIDFPFSVTEVGPDWQPPPIDGATTRVDPSAPTDEAYEAILAAAMAGEFIGLDGSEILASRKETSRARLLDAMAELRKAGDEGSQATALDVAGHLMTLGDPAGRALLFGSLRSDDAEIRKLALGKLESQAMGRADDERLALSADEAALVFALLEDPNAKVAEKAVQVAGIHRLPGVVEHFRHLLPRRDAPDRGRIAYWLGKLDEPERALPLIVAYLRSVAGDPETASASDAAPDPLRTASALHWLAGQAQSGASWSGAARDAVEDFYAVPLRAAKVRDDGPPHKIGGHFAQQLVGPFAEVATSRSVPALREVFEQAVDSTSRGYALIALARLRPDESPALFRAALRPGESTYYLLQSIAGVLAGDTDSAPSAETVAAVEQFVVEHAGSFGHEPLLVDLLVDRFGERGRSVLQELVEESPTLRQRAAWRLGGWTVEEIVADAHRMGLLADQPTQERLLAARQQIETEWGRELEGPELLLRMFALFGSLNAFDAESDQYPSPHDELVLGYAGITGGLLDPQHVRQSWVEDWEGDEDETPLQVELVEDGRLYRFEVENFGDWFDVDRVHRAMNRVLADDGHAQRFFSWQEEDQVAYVVFGMPEAMAEFAGRWAIPIADNPSSARNIGRAFEAQVLQHLRDEG